MVLTKSGSHELEFEARTPAGPQLLGALPIAALGVVFLFAPPPYTAVRLLSSAVLIGAAAVLALRSLPRSRAARLDLERQRLLLPDGRELGCSNARAFVLTAAAQLSSRAARHEYRVELELGPGQRAVLLEHRDPARVLGDLSSLLRHLELPVRPGWGLPADATPWLPPDPRPRTVPAPAEARATPFPAQRSAGLTILIGSLAIGTIMLLMYLARGERGAPTAALSVALSLTTLGVLLLIAAVLLTDVVVLTQRPDGITIERRVLGLCRKRRRLEPGSVSGAWAVSPASGEAHHVLIRTTTELFALPCTGSDALRVAAVLTGKR